MDWTGGARNRFASTKSKTVTQKQKAHFAKARAALQATPRSKASFQPLYLPGGYAGIQSMLEPNNEHQVSHQHLSHATKALRHDGEGRHVTTSADNRRRSTRPSEASSSRHADRPRHMLRPKKILDEEALLLATRKRLLAQSDWLHLDASRPLQMQFPSHKDKDRIGKRRKISKAASQRPQPAQKRELSPLFRHHLMHPPYLGNDVLPQDNQIHIRIGTEALATQTQRSQSPSTRESKQFSPISEESMLLDADEEIPLLPVGPSRESNAAAASVTAFAGSQMTRPFALTHPQQPCQSHYEPKPSESQQTSHSDDPPSPSAVLSSMDLYTSHDSSIGSQQPCSEKENPPPQHGVETSPRQHTLGDPDNAAYIEHDDEATWRMLMRIKPLAPSGESIAALRSSSQHQTTSESSHRPLPNFNAEHQHGRDIPSVSTPRGAGTQGELLISGHDLASSEERLPSSSESLKQIFALANQQPSLPTTNEPLGPRESPDHDTLWRQFIIGNDDDDGHSEDTEELPSKLIATNNARVRGVTSPVQTATGHASSNAATAGETLFVTGNTSPVAHLLNKQNRTGAAGFQQPPANHYVLSDGAEDGNSCRRPANFHAMIGTVSFASKQSREKRKSGGVTRRDGTYMPAGQRSARKASVYDLLDSDGNLLA